MQLTWEDLYYNKVNPRDYKQDTDFNDVFMSVDLVDYTAVDLDVDSKNDSGYSVPDNNAEEDSLEEDSSKGKYLVAPISGVTGVELVPLVVRLGPLPDSSTFGRLTFSFGGLVQVFKAGAAGTEPTPIHSGQPYSLADLGVSTGDNVFYMQAVGGAEECVPVAIGYDRAGAESNSDTVHVAPVSLWLKEVQFSATEENQFFDNVILDDGTETNAWGYDWQQSSRFGAPFTSLESPIVYRGGATMVAERRIEIKAPNSLLGDDAPAKVLKGTPAAASRYQFHARSDGQMDDAAYKFERVGGTLVVRDSAAQPLYDKVDYQELSIPWEFSIDGGQTFVNLGTSTNQLYSLLPTPLGGVAREVRHTSVHVSTVAARDRITEEGVLLAVWNEFADRSVRKAPVKAGDPPGPELVYTHNNFATDNFKKFFLGVEGTCQSWSRFLADALALHGIESQVMDIMTNNAEDVRPAPTDAADRYDKVGGIFVGLVPAQGSGGAVYTERTFNFHSVLVVSSRPAEIFDPSYGRLWSGTTLADALRAWEIESLVSTQHYFEKPGGEKYFKWIKNRPGISDVRIVPVAFDIF
jgi:hypothetical protein